MQNKHALKPAFVCTHFLIALIGAAAYEELNAELKRDISRLMNDADNFFAPLLATLFSIQTTFYGHLYNRKNSNLAAVE